MYFNTKKAQDLYEALGLNEEFLIKLFIIQPLH